MRNTVTLPSGTDIGAKIPHPLQWDQHLTYKEKTASLKFLQ